MDLNEHFRINRLFMEYNEECFLEHTHPLIEVFFLMNASLKMICFLYFSIFKMSQNKCLLYYFIHKHTKLHILVENFRLSLSLAEPSSIILDLKAVSATFNVNLISFSFRIRKFLLRATYNF